MSEPGDQRLGVFVENAYLVTPTADGLRVNGHASVYAFTMFAAEVGSRFRSATFFGRARRGEGEDTVYHPLPDGVRLVELPYYESLIHVRELARALPGAVRRCWRGLEQVDVVWVLGPHPFSFLVLALALLRRKRVVLGVRQDTVSYYRSRLRSAGWLAALPLVWLMDRLFRLLSRRLPTTVVGAELAGRYGGNAPVLPMVVSLIHAADVPPAPPPRDFGGELELLTVGRIEPEKAPFLLVEAFAELERRQPGRFHLTWAGGGTFESAVRNRIEALGLADRVSLVGYVRFGPELLDLYRRANVFVHVAVTEGVPQAVIEAAAFGTPVVATDVGGVRAALDDGAAGILVPPGERDALVDAVLRAADDKDTRDRIVERGLAVARAAAKDVEAARVADFLAAPPSSVSGRYPYRRP
jgi:glycosyltransferase involved in cell wall biosynthesis